METFDIDYVTYTIFEDIKSQFPRLVKFFAGNETFHLYFSPLNVNEEFTDTLTKILLPRFQAFNYSIILKEFEKSTLYYKDDNLIRITYKFKQLTEQITPALTNHEIILLLDNYNTKKL